MSWEEKKVSLIWFLEVHYNTRFEINKQMKKIFEQAKNQS